MASFTDQIVAFNPYHQQIPVDDYVRVGLMKQEAYDQGVQKVQGYIDSVAGIDVIKPEQKDYLDQRIGQLQNEVSKIVQRDFSNQQLVNSVGNLTSKIASDPVIVNAELSTRRYRAGVSAMKAAREKGESGPSNEWYFQNEFQKWYNDKDVTSSFNGQFTKFTDVNKKVLGAIKEVTGNPNITTEDIPYKRNGDGSIQKDASGLPIIDYAMMEKTTKGVSPERIQMAIRANLDTNDLRQLQIDGMYTYRGLDKQALKGVTDQSYQMKLDQINDTIKGLMVSRQTNTGNPNHLASIDAQINSLQTLAQKYQNRYKQDIGSLDSDPEGFKANLYMENYLSRFGEGYAYSQNSLTYKENPFFMAAERRRENDIRYQEFLINKQFQAANLALEEARLNISREELEIKRQLAAKKLKSKGKDDEDEFGLPLIDAVPDAIDEELVAGINVDTFVSETNAISDQIETQKMALIAQVRPDLVGVVRSPDGTQRRYEYLVSGKDPNVVKNEANATILKLKDSYDKGEKVDDGVKSYFDQLANATQSIDNRKYALGKIQSEADRLYDVRPLTASVAPLTITLSNGRTSNVPVESMIRINDKLNMARNMEPAKAAALFTTPEEQYIYNAYKKSVGGLPGITPSLSQAEKTALQKVREVSNLTSSAPVQMQTNARNTYLNNSVRDLVGVKQPTAFTIEAFKAEDRNRAAAVARELIGSMSRRGTISPPLPGSEELSTNWRGNISKVSTMLEEKNLPGTSFSLVSKGAGRYAMRLTNNDVNKEGEEIPLTVQQANSLFGEESFLDNFSRIRESLQLTRGTGRVTTDVQGLGRESAFKLQNGNINNYGVKYHVEEPLKNGGLQLRLYIYDKQAGQWLPDRTVTTGSMLNESQITRLLSGLTDQSIKELIERK